MIIHGRESPDFEVDDRSIDMISSAIRAVSEFKGGPLTTQELDYFVVKVIKELAKCGTLQ